VISTYNSIRSAWVRHLTSRYMYQRWRILTSKTLAFYLWALLDEHILSQVSVFCSLNLSVSANNHAKSSDVFAHYFSTNEIMHSYFNLKHKLILTDCLTQNCKITARFVCVCNLGNILNRQEYGGKL
jgi:hypothetical protein